MIHQACAVGLGPNGFQSEDVCRDLPPGPKIRRVQKYLQHPGCPIMLDLRINSFSICNGFGRVSKPVVSRRPALS